MQTTITALADKYGVNTTLTTVGGGTHALSGTVSGATTYNMTGKAVIREVTAKMVDGASILAGDLILLVSSTWITAAPRPGATRASIDSIIRVCTMVRSYRIAGTVYGYDIYMRGAA